MVFPRVRVKATLAAALCVLCVLQGTDAEDSSSSGSSLMSTQASVPVTCSLAVSEGDAAFGINIETDTSCANGGVGCIDNVCRFCKTTENAQSSHFQPCGSVTAASVSDSCVAAQTDIDVGVTSLADASCADGGLGCYNSHCRFCKFRSTAQSAHLLSCSDFGYASLAQSSTGSVASPAADSSMCTATVSEGDAAVGIAFATDPTCVNGGLGCYGAVCRFCQVSSTPQSAHLFPCSNFVKASDSSSFGQTLDLPSSDGSTWTSVAPSSIGVVTDAPSSDGQPTDAPWSTDATDTPAPFEPVTDAPSSDGLSTDAPSSSDISTTPGVTTEAPSSIDAIDTPAPFEPITDAPITDAPTTDATNTDAPSVSDTVDSVAPTEPSTDTPSNSDTANTLPPMDPATNAPSDVTDTPTSTGATDTPGIIEPSTDAPSTTGVTDTPSTSDGTDNSSVTEPSTDAPSSTGVTETPSTIDQSSSASAASTNTDVTETPIVTEPSTNSPSLSTDTDAPTQSTTATPAPESSTPSPLPATVDTVSPVPALSESVCPAVSAGDAAVGIQLIADPSCGSGGLGCYENACRFCKVRTTTQSAHLLSCSDFGFAFGLTSSSGSVASTPSPTAASNVCTEIASEGDSAVGIAFATDPTCVQGGLGCYGAVCRFCQVIATPQSAHLFPCSNFAPTTDDSSFGTFDLPSSDGSTWTSVAPSSIGVVTDAPSSDGQPTDAPWSTDATDTPAPFEPVTDAPSSDGLSTDAPSSSDISTTPGVTTEAPSSIDAIDTPAPFEPITDAPITDAPTTDATNTDAPSVSDTVDSVAPTEPSTDTPSNSDTANTLPPMDPATNAPSDVTDTPTSTGATDTPGIIEPSTDAPSTTGVTDTPSTSDGTDNSSVTEPSTDAPSSTGVTETPSTIDQSSSASAASTNTDVTETPIVTEPSTNSPSLSTDTDAPTQSTTATPAPESSTPSPLPATVDTVSPVPALSESVCPAVSAGDAAVGIQLIADPSCGSGGLGCYENACRFCKVRTTTQSAHLLSCSQIGFAVGSASNAGSMTGTPSPTTNSNVCTATVSEGDSAVGISLVTDSTCVHGGLGCFNNVCRFCRVTSTPKSAHLLNCSDFATQTPATPTTQTPTASSTTITTTAPTPTPASPVCAASSGDAAVGIFAMSDATCVNGGLGCYNAVCRFCKVRATPQSQHLINCTSLTTPTVTAMKAAAVSSADKPNELEKIMKDGTFKWLITATAGFGVAAAVAMMAFAVKTSIRRLANIHSDQNAANVDKESPSGFGAENASVIPSDDSSVVDEV